MNNTNNADESPPSSSSGVSTTVTAGGGGKYRLVAPAKLPISRSPCLTIPPGLSPSSFLESPVFLSNIKGEPSPTTGSFFMTRMMHNSSDGPTSFPSVINSSNIMDGSNSSSFEFKPIIGSFLTGGFSFATSTAPSVTSTQQQAVQSMEVQPEFRSDPSSVAFKSEVGPTNDPRSSMVIHLDDDIKEDSINESQTPDSELKALGSQVSSDRVSDDGYNWRKYGQKLVKGSEYPRSYYKCTHPNCEVKKLFERSPDGQITEIIYKGTHDHPKPQPNRRLPGGSIMCSPEEKLERVPSMIQDGRSANSFGQTTHDSELIGLPDGSPCGELDGEGGSAQLNRVTDDADDEDQFAKRRRMEIGEMDINSVVKPIREPRVVVQTVSEVDILDDGYRWRKYGQKVVRGNPNPRSYYKCTHPGCPVRKHVERASHDPKAVITTYEGKHNHEVPTARNTSHDTAPPSSSRAGPHHDPADAVSLDLGVGIRPPPGFGPGQTQFTSPSMLFLRPGPGPGPGPFPGYVNGPMVMYGSRENPGQGHNMGNPPVVSHPSNPYQQNMGRILMGP